MKRLPLIIEAYRQYVEVMPTASPITAASQIDIDSRSQLQVGQDHFDLDPEFIHLAGQIDGLIADDVRFYPVKTRTFVSRRGRSFTALGILEANIDWRAAYERSYFGGLLIYGQSDTSLFVKNSASGLFEHRSRDNPGRAYFTCATFEECLYEAVKYALEIAD